MKITYRQALREALKEALVKRSDTFLLGEDVGAYGGSYAVSKDLLKEIGPERIIDAPLSESGFVGLGIGAALGGLRPIIEVMTINFGLLALNQIINSAAFYYHMSGGQLAVPLVIRTTTGGGRQLAAQHSNSLEGWLSHIPGLKIFTPSSVMDARYALGSALSEQGPVLIFEHASLLNKDGEFLEKPKDYRMDRAQVVKLGSDLTLVSYGFMLDQCLIAAIELEKNKISVEVIDLRSLRPLDHETIFKSVQKTKALLIVDEGWKSGGISAEIISRLAEDHIEYFSKPPRRLCRKEVPLPYPRHLELEIIPQVRDIIDAVRGMRT